MEVKGLEHWGADWRNVVTGELLEVRRHPRADRLSLTRVRVGDEVLEIVCGATNVAAGQRVPVALPERSSPAAGRSSAPRRWASSATACCARATSCG